MFRRNTNTHKQNWLLSPVCMVQTQEKQTHVQPLPPPDTHTQKHTQETMDVFPSEAQQVQFVN